MTKSKSDEELSAYLIGIVRNETPAKGDGHAPAVDPRIEKAFGSLPEDVRLLFVTGERNLTVRILPNPGMPLGLRTFSKGPADQRTYTINLYEEHLDWDDNRLIGAFLRELAHVVIETPPLEEWPEAKDKKAEFKELSELKADVQLWRWGLRHYSMAFLWATYPDHWAERIQADIERMLQEETEKYH